jgi:hypothetical protein
MGVSFKGTTSYEFFLHNRILNISSVRSRDMNDTVVTLAHELAHSLGSKHDEDVRLFTL